MIDLSENTNRWGMPPASRRVLLEPGLTSAYPEANALSLRRALAGYVNAPPEQIVCGCGSDDVLDAALTALARPGDLIAIPEPTFRMMPLFARARGLIVAPTAPRADFGVDVDAVIACRPRLVYIASPGNPTGLTTPAEDIDRILRETNAIVIVDEAYAEFEGVTVLDLLPRSSRLLVTRTFSKAFGLAALRVGYAVGSPELVAAVAAVRGPYQVNSLAARAAIAALEEGVSWMRQTAGYAVHSRDVLARELLTAGRQALASRANFLLVPLAGAPRVAELMRRDGVAVRAFADLAGIGDAIRITAGPWPEMEAALLALASATTEAAPVTGSSACA